MRGPRTAVIDAGSDASGFAGNRLGAVRDAKGKSVAQVFAGMETSKKAEVSSDGDPRQAAYLVDSPGSCVQGSGKHELDEVRTKAGCMRGRGRAPGRRGQSVQQATPRLVEGLSLYGIHCACFALG